MNNVIPTLHQTCVSVKPAPLLKSNATPPKQPNKRKPDYEEAEAHFALWRGMLAADRSYRDDLGCWQLLLGDILRGYQVRRHTEALSVVQRLTRETPIALIQYRAVSNRIKPAWRWDGLKYGHYQAIYAALKSERIDDQEAIHLLAYSREHNLNPDQLQALLDTQNSDGKKVKSRPAWLLPYYEPEVFEKYVNQVLRGGMKLFGESVRARSMSKLTRRGIRNWWYNADPRPDAASGLAAHETSKARTITREVKPEFDDEGYDHGKRTVASTVKEKSFDNAEEVHNEEWGVPRPGLKSLGRLRQSLEKVSVVGAVDKAATVGFYGDIVIKGENVGLDILSPDYRRFISGDSNQEIEFGRGNAEGEPESVPVNYAAKLSKWHYKYVDAENKRRGFRKKCQWCSGDMETVEGNPVPKENGIKFQQRDFYLCKKCGTYASEPGGYHHKE